MQDKISISQSVINIFTRGFRFFLNMSETREGMCRRKGSTGADAWNRHVRREGPIGPERNIFESIKAVLGR